MEASYPDNLSHAGGLGSVFRSIYQTTAPIARKFFTSSKGKQVLREVRRSALRSGLKLAHDALRGKNINESAKQVVKELGKKMLEKTASAINSTNDESRTEAGKKRKKRARSSASSKALVKKLKMVNITRRGSHNDIFDEKAKKPEKKFLLD